MPRLNIGITISIKKEETSIFTNGAKQAAFFLLETLKNRHNVMLINLDLGNPSHAEVDWGIDNLPIVPYEESRHMKFHIVIEEGMQMAPSQLLEYQESGAKCITFRTGNDYFMTIENMMFRQGQVVRSNRTVNPAGARWGYTNMNRCRVQFLTPRATT